MVRSLIEEENELEQREGPNTRGSVAVDRSLRLVTDAMSYMTGLVSITVNQLKNTNEMMMSVMLECPSALSSFLTTYDVSHKYLMHAAKTWESRPYAMLLKEGIRQGATQRLDKAALTESFLESTEANFITSVKLLGLEAEALPQVIGIRLLQKLKALVSGGVDINIVFGEQQNSLESGDDGSFLDPFLYTTEISNYYAKGRYSGMSVLSASVAESSKPTHLYRGSVSRESILRFFLDTCDSKYLEVHSKAVLQHALDHRAFACLGLLYNHPRFPASTPINSLRTADTVQETVLSSAVSSLTRRPTISEESIISMITTLIEAKADINMFDGSGDSNPLLSFVSLAPIRHTRFRHSRLLRFLLRRADVAVRDSHDRNIVEIVNKRMKRDAWTPVHESYARHAFKVFKFGSACLPRFASFSMKVLRTPRVSPSLAT